MRPTIGQLIKSYQRKGVLVDTNLLILYIVGATDPDLISKFERTEKYDVEDYELLLQLLRTFKSRLVTPNVITEISNLSRGSYRQSLLKTLRETFTVLEEEYVPTGKVIYRNEFLRFGITDAALCFLVQRKCLLLTVDLPLANYCESNGGHVINFNNILGWDWTQVMS